MKRHHVRIAALVLIVAVVAGGIGWQRMTASAAPATSLPTTKVTRGSLAVNVSGD